MKKMIWVLGCLAVAGTLSAEDSSNTKMKKVWTNDDFVSARPAAIVAPAPAAAKVDAKVDAKVGAVVEAQTSLETEGRLQLRQHMAGEMKTLLEEAKLDVMHATNQEQRALAVTKIKLLEREIEAAGAEIHQLEAKLAVLKGAAE